METVFKCRRIKDGLYKYRGHKLERSTTTGPGYWGHWRTNSNVGSSGYLKSHSLKALRMEVDRALELAALQAKEAEAQPNAEGMVVTLQADPAASYWLKQAAADLAKRDPVDALNDAQKLLMLATQMYVDATRTDAEATFLQEQIDARREYE